MKIYRRRYDSVWTEYYTIGRSIKEDDTTSPIIKTHVREVTEERTQYNLEKEFKELFK